MRTELGGTWLKQLQALSKIVLGMSSFFGHPLQKSWWGTTKSDFLQFCHRSFYRARQSATTPLAHNQNYRFKEQKHRHAIWLGKVTSPGTAYSVESIKFAEPIESDVQSNFAEKLRCGLLYKFFYRIANWRISTYDSKKKLKKTATNGKPLVDLAVAHLVNISKKSFEQTQTRSRLIWKMTIRFRLITHRLLEILGHFRKTGPLAIKMATKTVSW